MATTMRTLIDRRRFLKRGSLLLPAAFAFPAIVRTATVTIVQPAAAAPAGCDTLRDSASGATHSLSNLGDNIARVYIAGKFTATASYTCCRIDLPLYKSGSPTQSIGVGIWSHDGAENDPSTLIDEATLDAATLPASDPAAGTWPSVTGVSVALTSGTDYWVVCHAAPYDAGNFILWPRISTTGIVCNDGDGSGTWSDLITSRTAMFRLYSA